MSQATFQPDMSWAAVRSVINGFAASRGEWAGAPVPVDHVKLVMEPRYPFKGLNGVKLDKDEPPAANEWNPEVLNEWFCWRRSVQVYVVREDTGKSRAYTLPEGPGQRMKYWFNTFAVAAQEAWTIETETRAMEKLKDLVSAQAFKCYVLTGSFLETSKRSKVSYLFRKLRPTLAMRPDRHGQMSVLSALCLHPLGYYAESWAGVMTPTDDVIAHLVLMRGDEHGFWKKANHHSTWMASSGV